MHALIDEHVETDYGLRALDETGNVDLAAEKIAVNLSYFKQEEEDGHILDYDYKIDAEKGLYTTRGDVYTDLISREPAKQREILAAANLFSQHSNVSQIAITSAHDPSATGIFGDPRSYIYVLTRSETDKNHILARAIKAPADEVELQRVLTELGFKGKVVDYEGKRPLFEPSVRLEGEQILKSADIMNAVRIVAPELKNGAAYLAGMARYFSNPNRVTADREKHAAELKQDILNKSSQEAGGRSAFSSAVQQIVRDLNVSAQGGHRLAVDLYTREFSRAPSSNERVTVTPPAKLEIRGNDPDGGIVYKNLSSTSVVGWGNMARWFELVPSSYRNQQVGNSSRDYSSTSSRVTIHAQARSQFVSRIHAPGSSSNLIDSRHPSRQSSSRTSESQISSTVQSITKIGGTLRENRGVNNVGIASPNVNATMVSTRRASDSLGSTLAAGKSGSTHREKSSTTPSIETGKKATSIGVPSSPAEMGKSSSFLTSIFRNSAEGVRGEPIRRNVFLRDHPSPTIRSAINKRALATDVTPSAPRIRSPRNEGLKDSTKGRDSTVVHRDLKSRCVNLVARGRETLQRLMPRPIATERRILRGERSDPIRINTRKIENARRNIRETVTALRTALRSRLDQRNERRVVNLPLIGRAKEIGRIHIERLKIFASRSSHVLLRPRLQTKPIVDLARRSLSVTQRVLRLKRPPVLDQRNTTPTSPMTKLVKRRLTAPITRISIAVREMVKETRNTFGERQRQFVGWIVATLVYPFRIRTNKQTTVSRGFDPFSQPGTLVRKRKRKDFENLAPVDSNELMEFSVIDQENFDESSDAQNVPENKELNVEKPLPISSGIIISTQSTPVWHLQQSQSTEL